MLLRGITWDHPRGYNPLIAVSQSFFTASGVSVEWERRSLKDFGDYPIKPLAEQYDLIMIDHPFIPNAASQEILLPLEDWIAHTYLNDQAQHSVGPSYSSYSWNGRQWALPVDAAAQVSMLRPDLFDELGASCPTTWNDVFYLAKHLPEGIHIGLPFVPTDAICSLFSVCANIDGSDRFFDADTGFEVDVTSEAIHLLKRLLAVSHPSSPTMNPAQMYEHMCRERDLLYVPLSFGYVNYTRKDTNRPQLAAADVPSFTGEPRGAVLGGVGIAVSAFSRYPQEAVRFAMYVSSMEIQTSLYFLCDGQPAYLDAWKDPWINVRAGNFFLSTLKTMELAYVRPRTTSFNRFQEEAGKLLHGEIQREQPRDIVRDLNDLYRLYRSRGE